MQPIANRVDLDSISALVATFASCAALHAAAAETLERADLRAYAETARRHLGIASLCRWCFSACWPLSFSRS